ncbi:carbohydrate-binding family 9-like protein [Mucilaginibacter lutimaris]|uniref:Carbohydrate-binding family 9-like protein n=1 Tax=Mucilaginibacter lutimaris TaxID=931629 RepID=A0ABW2ZBU8_9SPHI
MDVAISVNIPYLNGFDDLRSVEDISKVLDTHERRPIRYAPWSAGEKQPEASFALAYDNDEIYLKYYVNEHTLKAEYSKFNDPVFEDSCVEFFIAFDDDMSYYNLEFNCMGTSRAQYGQHKNGRTFIPVNLLKTIRHQTLVKSTVVGSIQWELTLCIPKKIFMFHPALSFEQSKAKVNLFKCGDGLPQPHFLCWNKIEAQKPEFHLSRFFKEITFSRKAS